MRLDGRPLEGVLVYFLPDPDRETAGPRSVGLTDAGGRYQLRCDDQRDGAVIGRHRVVLEDMGLYSAARQEGAAGVRPPPGTIRGMVARLPTRYTAANLTPFFLEVKPGDQTIDLDLASGP